MTTNVPTPSTSSDGLFAGKGLWTYRQIREHCGIGRRILDRLVDNGVLRPVASQHIRTKFFLGRDLDRVFSTDPNTPKSLE